MLFYGPLVTPRSPTELDLFPSALVLVSPSTGDILWVEPDVPAHELQNCLALHSAESYSFTELKDGEFLMPGFVDTHIHASQVPNLGLGGQDQLLDWLQNTTFPTEAKFKDAQFAKQVYSSVVYRTLNLGTTTACYYATLHSESSSILADIALDKGQRAFIGKCNMDRESPDWYREQDAASSVRDTRQVIKYITSLNSKLVQPILTPRFAISCTDQLLTELGNLANEDEHRDLAIQTHISENLDEVAYVRQLFPDLPDYASVYDHFHLLRHNTVLAHGVHLTDAELALIKKRDAGISHCPTSNFNLRSGVAPVDRWVKQGLKVGLGTDVSGGFSLGMLSAVRDASIASKVVSFTDSNSTFLSIPTLVYLATLGGASVCNLSRRIGSLEPGKAFDALIVSIRHDAGNPALWGQGAPGYQAQGAADRKTLQQNLEKFLFCGDDRNIKSVYVAGKLVGGHEHFGGNCRSCAN